MLTVTGAARSINVLRTRYRENGEEDKLAALPTQQQCANFKRNSMLSSDPYRTYAGVNEALYDRRIETKDEFDALSDVDMPIYLGGYNGDLDESEQDKENIAPDSKKKFGFCFSTKKCMLSCRDAMIEHEEQGIATGWDGTWNLCNKG